MIVGKQGIEPCFGLCFRADFERKGLDQISNPKARDWNPFIVKFKEIFVGGFDDR